MHPGRGSSREVARRIDALGSGLRDLASGLADEAARLQRDLSSGVKISLPQFRDHLRDLEGDMAALEEGVERLEGRTLGACSLQELVGHGEQAYWRALEGVANLEAHLRNYGYAGGCPDPAPPDPFAVARSGAENLPPGKGSRVDREGGGSAKKRARDAVGGVGADAGMRHADGGAIRRRTEGGEDAGTAGDAPSPRTPAPAPRLGGPVGGRAGAGPSGGVGRGGSLGSVESSSIEGLILSPSLLALTRKYATQSPEQAPCRDTVLEGRDARIGEAGEGTCRAGRRKDPIGGPGGDQAEAGAGRTPTASHRDQGPDGLAFFRFPDHVGGSDGSRAASGAFGSPQYADKAAEVSAAVKTPLAARTPKCAAGSELSGTRRKQPASALRSCLRGSAMGRRSAQDDPPAARKAVTFTPGLVADSPIRGDYGSPPTPTGPVPMPVPCSGGQPGWASPFAATGQPGDVREGKPSTHAASIPVQAAVLPAIASPKLQENGTTPQALTPAALQADLAGTSNSALLLPCTTAAPPFMGGKDMSTLDGKDVSHCVASTPVAQPAGTHPSPTSCAAGSGVRPPVMERLAAERPCPLSLSSCHAPAMLADGDLLALPAFYRGTFSLGELNSVIQKIWESSRARGQVAFTPDDFIGLKSGYEVKMMLNCLRTLEYVEMDFDNCGVVYKPGAKLQGRWSSERKFDR
ncbi:unnamed protein product [Ostreobium quekettii]|uniref:Spindle and kinetochore-associated protein 3 n=1 Tax=Ostreobium quekettii TaxID=121088 RepID=A0A8S1JC04_9CHLO|nr:unnamed protein product [Ostreobium quekettii]